MKKDQMTKHQAGMRVALDLPDMQGNIVRPYGRFGFPVTRHMFFHISDAAGGRAFVEQVRHQVTTAERWVGIDAPDDTVGPRRPDVAINIGFSFFGLYALGLPTRTLRDLPDEFQDGMAKRCDILGDIFESAPEHWDPIWKPGGKSVHVWISLNAQAKPDGSPADALADQTSWLMRLAEGAPGVELLRGHAGANDAYQDSSAIMADGPGGAKLPTAREPFGFVDAISDPAFAGQYEPAEEGEQVVGGGKLNADGSGWSPLATGEFVLGYPSEAQELPPSAVPFSFMRNGTFMVYRKLHQNLGAFDSYIGEQAKGFQALGLAESEAAAKNTILAKIIGRWPSGIPLQAAPTWKDAQALDAQWADIPDIQRKGAARTDAEARRLLDYELMLTDFRYAGDEHGAACPVTAHARRVNPRDSLDPMFGAKGAKPGSALTNRRRIIRRGAPYGDAAVRDDASEHGVIFMSICASLFRQFEFVQQQWVHYGSSFNAGNDTDPLAGLRRPDPPAGPRLADSLAGRQLNDAKFVIPADGSKTGMPFVCANIPLFVQTRGGEYFFLPSMTALREIAEGVVDPT